VEGAGHMAGGEWMMRWGEGTTWTRRGEMDRCRRMRKGLKGASLIARSGGEQMARGWHDKTRGPHVD
jgi:hypothetical protein